ncbi:MAG: DUF86 domain-containing protein [Methanothrix sp.]|nr:DUF86 domain-containing protein [Methanothrix sp.]
MLHTSQERWYGLIKDDSVFLKHILDEIDFLDESGIGIKFGDLIKNKEKQRAWLRSLEVIGEATKNLSVEFREKHPEIEWRKVAGLRDKLIHHYFGVKWEIVWDVVKNEIPEIRLKIEAMLYEFDSTH